VKDQFLSLLSSRPVALILQGHSLSDFEAHREELIKFPMCYGAINDYSIAESVLGREVDFVLAFSPENTYQRGETGSRLTLWDAPARGYNSLHEFLLMCIEWQVPKVLLFGADGYSDDYRPYYKSGINIKQVRIHKDDTEIFNKKFPVEHGKTQIINVSPKSKYRTFVKVSYAECLKILNEDTYPKN